MERILGGLFLWSCFTLAAFTDPECVIDFKCAECVPENPPLVTRSSAASGERVRLVCAGGKFLNYPLKEELIVVCEEGRYRVEHDNSLRHLLELGCQENIFEDVMHQVESCPQPFQGRAYQMMDPATHSIEHLATICFDSDRAIAVRAHTTNAPKNRLQMRAHSDLHSPLSLLGNFNHMFDAKTRNDAERLYGDDASANKRLHELLKHEHHEFADQKLTSAELLSHKYFDEQIARVSNFVSNKVPAWKSVVEGNLNNIHRDIAKLMRVTKPRAILDIYSGALGVQSVKSGHGKTELYLKPGKRFPVPKYIWTVVSDRQTARAVAIVVVNDPFIAVSEIRDTLFCESVCSRIPWLHELRRANHYETPLYGLVFCCNINDFTNAVNTLPRSLFQNVPLGNDGLLTEYFA